MKYGNNKYGDHSTRELNPYVLLKKLPDGQVWVPETDPVDILVDPTYIELRDRLDTLQDSTHLILDLETNGTDFSHKDTYIVGVGLGWVTPDGSVQALYIEYTLLDDIRRTLLWNEIAMCRGVVAAHNLLFDGFGISNECIRLDSAEPKWTHCTYALFKLLATEGFEGQTWGLKSAQLNLLSWPETNEEGINSWLIEHGYVKGNKRKAEGESQEEFAARLNSLEGVTYKADKGEMWRVPAPILGSYCILDCLSTLQLYTDVLRPVMDKFPEFTNWVESYYMEYIRMHWMQVRSGIRVDMELLLAHEQRLIQNIQIGCNALREGPLARLIFEQEEEKLNAYMSTEPVRYKKFKLGIEPAPLTKGGKRASNWIKWDAKRAKGPELSKNWIKWMAKMHSAKGEGFPECRLNLGSGAQLRRLLYDTGIVQYELTGKMREKKGKQIPMYLITGINGQVEIEGTEAGLPPMNGDLYSQMEPELARPLQLIADASQELGYVKTYIQLARMDAGGNWRIHPGWRTPGTLTGRLAGGGGTGINFQQAPKTVEFLACLIPDEGEVWIEGDWSSLEPHVLAEVSQDPALLHLYGKGAKKHDVYLYSGANYAVLGDTIRKHYDVNNPDVSAAKKACKPEREAVKPVFLAKAYGGGADSIHRTLTLKGFKISLAQAKNISSSHDKFYEVSGRGLHEKLLEEWITRGGWNYNAIGRPIGTSSKKKKDLINQQIQSSGHDIHIQFIVCLRRSFIANGIAVTGIVWDFHDQFIISVRREDATRAMELVREVVVQLNKTLGGTIELKLEPKQSHNMAHAKEAEFSWESVDNWWIGGDRHDSSRVVG